MLVIIQTAEGNETDFVRRAIIESEVHPHAGVVIRLADGTTLVPDEVEVQIHGGPDNTPG